MKTGTVLLAVLIVVAIGAMIGTTAMYFAEAEGVGVAHSLKAAQSRAAAWSGVQAVMAELALQRESLLRGGAPTVTKLGTVFAEQDGRGARLVFRIVPVAEKLVESEGGKLDLNTASAEMLAKVPGWDAAVAGRIVAARGSERFASVLDLSKIEGISIEGVGGDSREPAGEWRAALVGPARTNQWHQIVTVFSFDPNVQNGAVTNRSDQRGRRRIDLHSAWSDEIGREVEREAEAAGAEMVKGWMTGGKPPATDGEMVRAMRLKGADARVWAVLLDMVTTSDAEYLIGRVDLNTAAAEVLACVPGISAEAAGKIVERRDKLDETQRATVMWPVLEGIVTGEQFESAVDHLTTRTMQWRVVVEAGWIQSKGASHGPADSATPSAGAEEEGALVDRVVLEAVIDVASQRARVAYLRDITLRPVAEALAAAAINESPGAAGRSDEPVLPESGSPVQPPVRNPVNEPVPASQADYRPPQPDRADQDSGTGRKPVTDGRIGRWTTGPSPPTTPGGGPR